MSAVALILQTSKGGEESCRKCVLSVSSSWEELVVSAAPEGCEDLDAWTREGEGDD